MPGADGSVVFTYAKLTTRGPSGLAAIRPDGTHFGLLSQPRSPVEDRAPAWSSDGATLAFVRAHWTGHSYDAGDIWAMDADGGHRRRLTRTGPIEDCPAWSPDDSKIALLQRAKPFSPPKLAVLDVTTHDISRLRDAAGVPSCPTWSPSGTSLLFTVFHKGHGNVTTMRTDGSHVAVLPSTHRVEYALDWSPNGARILFRAGSVASGSISSMEIDGSDRHVILAGGGPKTGYDDAAYSPDGTHIVAVRSPKDFEAWLYTADADGSHLHRMKNPRLNNASATMPSWQPLH